MQIPHCFWKIKIDLGFLIETISKANFLLVEYQYQWCRGLVRSAALNVLLIFVLNNCKFLAVRPPPSLRIKTHL